MRYTNSINQVDLNCLVERKVINRAIRQEAVCIGVATKNLEQHGHTNQWKGTQ